MELYIDEEQPWKCHKHPSKRRRTTGICPKCLRDRLLTLCPNCANTLPCNCSPPPLDSSSSSSSSSSDVDPVLRKSRSVAISFLRSRTKHVQIDLKNNNNALPPKISRSKVNFWSVFVKSKKCGDVHDDHDHDDDRTQGELNKIDELIAVDDNSMTMMMRSRSVAAGAGAGAGKRFATASLRPRGWYFPSPINAFRHSKSPPSVHVT
ncbi:hypothetical protein QVD17_40068 [Tagetes erecta]|uniref:Uncharacterized protein n=1 Tax=Tagetes erecta TaxID=13708 RepID=A0AAD8JTH8_TARER|nr:hypothetical protein QVD17_40068 [Tagetes erecta]